MPVVLDSGIFIGFFRANDPHHARATTLLREVLDGAHGTPLVPDAVVAEVLTFLRRRPGRRDVSTGFATLVATDGVLAPTATMSDVHAKAVATHLAQWDRRLSMVDCIVIEQARAAGAKAMTFESGWDGLVPILQ